MILASGNLLNCEWSWVQFPVRPIFFLFFLSSRAFYWLVFILYDRLGILRTQNEFLLEALSVWDELQRDLHLCSLLTSHDSDEFHIELIKFRACLLLA